MIPALWDMSLTPLAQLVCRLGLRPQLEIPWHAFASKRSFTDYHETLHAIVLKAPESLEWMCLESRRWSLFDSGGQYHGYVQPTRSSPNKLSPIAMFGVQEPHI